MDPWARVEQIPASVKSFDLYVYHVYGDGFYMPLQEGLRIMLAPQAGMNPEGDIWDKSLADVCKIKWPLEGSSKLPRNKMVKQRIATIEIDRKKFGNVPLCMHAVFQSHGGPWKSDWTFEAVAVEFSGGVTPRLDRSQKITPQNEPPAFN